MNSTDASTSAEAGGPAGIGSAAAHLLLPDWPAPAGVRGFATLRHGGVSRDAWGCEGGRPGGWNLGAHCGDAPADVTRNRALLRRLLPAEPLWLDQVHGTVVFDADARPGTPATPPRADAAVTARRGVVLAVLTADCLPVLVTNASGSVAGVAHAGWRGLAAGVLEATLDALERLTDDRHWLAWLGPAIGPGAFEVGDEVRQAFAVADPGSAAAFVPARQPGKWMADLPALAKRRLAQRGVASIAGGEACTVADPRRFYSYRRDHVTGRMASLLWLA